MSILLDALRKSEQTQRRGAVPTLDTQLPPPPRRRRRPGWLAWVALVAVAAAAAGWWFGVRTPAEPAAGEPPRAVSADEARAAPSSDPAARPSERSAMSEPSAGPPATEPAAVVAPAQPAPAGARTPVEHHQAPLERAAHRPAGPGPAAIATPVDAEADVVAGAVPDAPGTESAPSIAADGVDPAGRREIPDPEAALQASPEPEAPADGPYVGEPVSLWALPEDVRSRLPEFRISVLVYAARPADRFALVNGKRLGEGDGLAPGLELVEIRRDGAVFTFERYRFLVGR